MTAANHPARATRRRFISQQDAADYLGVDVRTIRRMISRGELAGYAYGHRLIRVDLNEVEQLLRPIPTAAGGSDGGS